MVCFDFREVTIIVIHCLAAVYFDAHNQAIVRTKGYARSSAPEYLSGLNSAQGPDVIGGR